MRVQRPPLLPRLRRAPLRAAATEVMDRAARSHAHGPRVLLPPPPPCAFAGSCSRITQRGSSRNLPSNYGQGSGEGTLGGPRGGINQHDRLGIDKASGWPGSLTTVSGCSPAAQLGRGMRTDGGARSHCRRESLTNLDEYPAAHTPDHVHTLSMQPFVTGVTSWSPNARRANAAYRNAAPLAYLSCAPFSAGSSCADPAFVTSAPHSFRAGDVLRISGVLAADPTQRRNLTGVDWLVRPDGLTPVAFHVSALATGAVVDTTAMVLDVSTAVAVKKVISTAANPAPPYGPHDWSYEYGDVIFFFVTFSEPVQARAAPYLRRSGAGSAALPPGAFAWGLGPCFGLRFCQGTVRGGWGVAAGRWLSLKGGSRVAPPAAPKAGSRAVQGAPEAPAFRRAPRWPHRCGAPRRL